MDDPVVIGVQAGGREIRLVEICRQERGIVLVRMERIGLEAGPRAPASGAAPAPSSSDTKNTTVCPPRVIACVPATDVMNRFWMLPDAEGVRLRQIAAHRLEADLPISLEEVVYGCRSVSRAGHDGAEIGVLAQAARRSRIERTLADLAALNLVVDVLTTEAEGLGALFRHGLRLADEAAPTALILAGEQEWLVCVMADRVVRMVRHLLVDTRDPESACRECHQFIASEIPSGKLKNVQFHGATEWNEGRRLLAEFMHIPVDPLELTEQIRLADGGRLDADQLVTYGAAIGLALAEISDDHIAIQLGGRRHLGTAGPRNRLEKALANPLRLTAVAAALLVVSIGIHLAVLRSETRRMQLLLSGPQPQKSALVALEPKVQAMRRMQRFRIDVEAIMADICSRIPDAAILSSIQLSRERRLVLKGTSQDPKTVFAFAESLRQSERFSNVNPERTAPGRGGEFTISLELAKVEKLTTAGMRGGPWQ